MDYIRRPNLGPTVGSNPESLDSPELEANVLWQGWGINILRHVPRQKSIDVQTLVYTHIQQLLSFSLSYLNWFLHSLYLPTYTALKSG